MIMFDLRKEPWIPVVSLDGTPVEVGFTEVISNAHKYRAIAADNPLQTMSLYRVLVGMVQHLLGDVRGDKEWGATYQEGQFDAEQVEEYLYHSAWSDRFDLFSPDKPFWQVPGLRNIDQKTGEDRPLAAKTLDISVASGNNKTLFSHHFDAQLIRYSPAQATRLLCTAQLFSLGGLNKKTTNRTGYQQSYFHAPLVSGMPSLLIGNNLFQTICLNLVSEQGRLSLNVASLKNLGLPPWAQDPFVEGKSLPSQSTGTYSPSTYLEYFLPWSRYIRLVPEEERPGVVSVAYLHIAQGVAVERLDEPWTAKRIDSKTGERSPVPFNPERSLWRDTGAFLGLTSASAARPYGHIKSVPLQLYSRYRGDSRNSLPFVVPMAVFALANEKAKPLLWRQEELGLPDVDAAQGDLAAGIQQCLEQAESIGGILKAAVARLAQEILRNSDRGREALPSRLADGSSPFRTYWSELDLPFRRFLAGDSESIDFIRTSLRVAENAFEVYARQTVGTDVRYFHALSKSRVQLRRSLKKKKTELQMEEEQHAW